MTWLFQPLPLASQPVATRLLNGDSTLAQQGSFLSANHTVALGGSSVTLSQQTLTSTRTKLLTALNDEGFYIYVATETGTLVPVIIAGSDRSAALSTSVSVVSAGTAKAAVSRLLATSLITSGQQSVASVENKPTQITSMLIGGGTGTVTPQGPPVTVNLNAGEIEMQSAYGSVGAGQPLTTQVSAVEKGTLTIAERFVPLGGSQSNSGLGQLAPNQDTADTYIASDIGSVVLEQIFALSGSRSDTAQGTITAVIGDQSHPITTQVSATETGSLAVDLSLPLSGSSVTTAQDFLGGWPITLALTGQSATLSDGRLYLDNDRDYPLTGVSTTAEQGSPTTIQAFALSNILILSYQPVIGDHSADLSGEQMDSGIGEVLPPAVLDVVYTGGWRKRMPRNARHLYTRIPTDAEVMAERERLGILPKRTQKLITDAVRKASSVADKQQAAVLLPAYLQEAKQRAMLGNLKERADQTGVKWEDDIMPISQALIMDSLRRKADPAMMKQLLDQEAAEKAEIDKVLELWMEL